MKIRHSNSEGEKIVPQMAPMIDVVFQLLIFFMLTLKIVEPEGDFNINMPLTAPSQDPSQDVPLYDIKVKLRANPDGSLAQLSIGGNNLGNGPAAFQRLNDEVLKLVGGGAGVPMIDDMEVEIDADYNLNFQYAISAVSACTGRLNESGDIDRYVEKIKFAQPRRPSGM